MSPSESSENATLVLYMDSSPLFSSSKKWLYPLFELEEFLNANGLDPRLLKVRDKIVGKAAAALMARLHIGEVHAGVLSRLGQQVLDRWDIHYRSDSFVDRISCQTESVLQDVDDLEIAYGILKQRAGLLPGQGI